MSTNVQSFIGELDAGIFEKKVSRALSDVALAVINNGKAGKVTLTFDVTQIDASCQVSIKQKLNMIVPTKRGKSTEEDTTPSTMYVGTTGALTLYPQDQVDMFNYSKNKQEA